MFVRVGDTIFYIQGDGVGKEVVRDDYEAMGGYLATGKRSHRGQWLMGRTWFLDSGAAGEYVSPFVKLYRGHKTKPNGKRYLYERAYVLGVKKTRAEIQVLYNELKEVIDHAEKGSCWIV